MRLFRLAGWALLGYLFYQAYEAFVSVLSSDSISRRGSGDSGRGGAGVSEREMGRALNEGGRMNKLRDASHGRTVETKDADGGRMSHMVGRGVKS